jgi:hypothetical protein
MTKFKWVALFVAAFLLGGLIRIKAQSLPVILLTAPAGSTLANCGTPTIPTMCIVTPGVYVWQNATQGWFLVAPAAASGVSSVQQCNLAGANCGTAQTGAVVLKVPQTVSVTVANPTVAVAAPAVTATAAAPSATATQGAVTATLQ